MNAVEEQKKLQKTERRMMDEQERLDELRENNQVDNLLKVEEQKLKTQALKDLSLRQKRIANT